MTIIGRQDGTTRVTNLARRAEGQPKANYFGGRRSRVEPVSAPRDADDGGIKRLCIERGLKMTGQRRTIARVLTEADDHPDVEEMYRRAG